MSGDKIRSKNDNIRLLTHCVSIPLTLRDRRGVHSNGYRLRLDFKKVLTSVPISYIRECLLDLLPRQNPPWLLLNRFERFRDV